MHIDIVLETLQLWGSEDTGHIVYQGQWYQGKHPAMISAEEFERVPSVVTSKPAIGGRVKTGQRI